VNYQVYLELGGQHYLVVPVDQGLLGLNTESSSVSQVSGGQPVISGKLPEEFEFSKNVSATVSQPAIPFEWLAKLPGAKDWKWMEGSFPITFYPDGTAAIDLQQPILKQDQQVSRILLRGLTGNTTISYKQEKSP
ncbi:MAG: hypothetical protein KDA74_21105, partial [Planctomycetaceae bacterium]|nr:hypothetical protein [Planctomycetaceae bacterium]